MTGTSTYVIRGGPQGRERLRVVARVMWPTTAALFERVGVAADARVLDLGCGGGDVTMALAAMAPDGRVVGTDVDDAKLDLAREEAAAAGLEHVELRVHDVLAPPEGDERFDLVYARFLLTHLPDPAAALANVRALLAPGGAVVVEDIDFTGHFCHPRSEAFWRYVQLYSDAVRARGCDPDIGPRLPSLLRDAGFADVGMHVVQPAGFEGEVKLLAPITLEAIADAVLAADLISAAELERTVDELYRFAEQEGTVLSIPRVVQAWGRCP
jgi:predicted O-methyltransferase YrrM